MLQADEPSDYGVATWVAHLVRNFVTLVSGRLSPRCGEHASFDECYLRVDEIDPLIGDASDAKAVRCWTASALTPEFVAIIGGAHTAHLEDEFSSDHARRSCEPAVWPAGSLA